MMINDAADNDRLHVHDKFLTASARIICIKWMDNISSFFFLISIWKFAVFPLLLDKYKHVVVEYQMIFCY